ncbi:MAG: YdeI/OmpD-associated family protein [Bacteroidetes bacterium]|nr:YdeI/OmpD-associated family protein [Bacteroidota bacterium]
MLKSIRQKIGKDIGDTVDIAIWHDTEERKVDVPKDFAKALKESKLKAAFDKMSYSHQREYVKWIEEAKKEETRFNRIVKAIEKITENLSLHGSPCCYLLANPHGRF